MKDQGEEVIPIKKDMVFMEKYQEIVTKIDKLRLIELRAVGKAIGNAISLSEKLTSEYSVEYVRMTTEEFIIEDRKNVLCIIRLKKVADQKSKNESNKKMQYVEKKKNNDSGKRKQEKFREK